MQDTGLLLSLPESDGKIDRARGSIDGSYDPASRLSKPPRLVELGPFLMSKFETTQALWLRLTGENPSAYTSETWGHSNGPHNKRLTLLHPVEQLDWFRGTEVLGWFELDLPTSAQWEFAARGGTSSPWYTGSVRESLAGHVNLADSTLDRHSPRWKDMWCPHEQWLEDGYILHAPVGSFCANPFGMHDIEGNVMEWCKDKIGAGAALPLDPMTGLVLLDSTDPILQRVFRGSSFMRTAGSCRSASSDSWDGRFVSKDLGLRAARQLHSSR